MKANDLFRFTFDPAVSFEQAELTLHLALFAASGLYGEARIRLEAAFHANESSRTIVIDAGDEIGASVVKVYTALLLREFGEDSFQVRRTTPCAIGPARPVKRSSKRRPTVNSTT